MSRQNGNREFGPVGTATVSGIGPVSIIFPPPPNGGMFGEPLVVSSPIIPSRAAISP